MESLLFAVFLLHLNFVEIFLGGETIFLKDATGGLEFEIVVRMTGAARSQSSLPFAGLREISRKN